MTDPAPLPGVPCPSKHYDDVLVRCANCGGVGGDRRTVPALLPGEPRPDLMVTLRAPWLPYAEGARARHEAADALVAQAQRVAVLESLLRDVVADTDAWPCRLDPALLTRVRREVDTLAEARDAVPQEAERFTNTADEPPPHTNLTGAVPPTEDGEQGEGTDA